MTLYGEVLKGSHSWVFWRYFSRSSPVPRSHAFVPSNALVFIGPVEGLKTTLLCCHLQICSRCIHDNALSNSPAPESPQFVQPELGFVRFLWHWKML
ncbi:hypothetical protein SKAU_G00185460 [Synaphobranchus kaupii]|uniref:Uncharacterized protein n=1 Tax=Synaphobranchus kaupii TaxID=118154 RepID=A0A9Q1FCJ6_SYNKA|nr:hypothetical protein SKAU_G00185460 [Synaphobranchus kaupii]